MGRLFIASASMLVTGIILLLTAANLGVAILSMLLVSILISYVNIVGITQIQRETPPDLLGRMMGLLNMR
jgi:hypothetical protein